MPVESRRQPRAMTLSDQLAVPDSPDLRDLLRTHNTSRRRRRQCLNGGHRSSITLASIIAADKREAPRTLLDVLRDDEEGEPSEGRALRPRRGDAAWTASPDAASVETQVPPPPPEPEITTLEVILAEDQPALGEAPPPTAAVAAPDLTERPVRLSLMALLEQTELPAGGGGGMVPEVVVEEEEEEEDREDREREEKARCCVCMARRKGAAFIPCGHTFCRRCSRELWVRRGSCPLCNAAIGDILDIY